MPRQDSDRTVHVVAAGVSDVGKQREHNEDRYRLMPEYDLYLVADGMGGHRAGDVASTMATDVVGEFFRATASEDATWPFHFDPKLTLDENRLMTGIKVANRKIFDASMRDRSVQGMGTTIVGVLFSKKENQMYVAHVGDSRCYLLRNGKLQQLTRDHSLVNDYLAVMPDMPKEQQDELPRNVITRALGMQDSVTVDVLSEGAKPGDQLVLCSDGLTGMVEDEQIRALLEASGDNVEAAAKQLVDMANANGGEDNVTVVTLTVLDGGLLDDLGAEGDTQIDNEPLE